MVHVKDTYRTVTPYLLVPDADLELTFLKAAFDGTELGCQRNQDNTVMHAEVEIGDSLVMLAQTPEQQVEVLQRFLVDRLTNVDVHEVVAKALLAVERAHGCVCGSPTLPPSAASANVT